MPLRFSPLALTALLLIASGAAIAQDLDATGTPRFGILQLSDGAQDALDLTLSPEAEVPQEDCPGYITPGDPDAVIEWNGGGPFRIWLRSASDGVLVVRAPLGETLCNDDADGVQPAIEIGQARPGRYAVWAGTFSQVLDASAAATLYAGTPPEAVSIASGASARAVTIEGSPDGETIGVTAGGGYTASALGLPDYCVGFFDPEPSVRLTVPQGFFLTTDAQADLVLAMRADDGEWMCNDDGGEGSNPGIEIPPSDDAYTVWVGTFRGFARGEAPEADLVLMSEAPRFPEPEIVEPPFNSTPFSEASYTPLDLSSSGEAFRLGTDAEEIEMEARVTGENSNPVSGVSCSGAISPEATATLSIDGESEGPISILASGGEADLVMVARTDDGRWFCSDDASGRDPAIEVEGVQTVTLWVGTYSIGQSADAVIAAIRAPLENVLPDEVTIFDDYNQNRPQPYAPGTYIGNGLDLEGEPSARITFDGSRSEVSVSAGGRRYNPVEGPACSGYLSTAPSAIMEAGDGPLAFAATGAGLGVDLTMVLLTPSGNWFCSDDFGGTDPGIEVSGEGDGAYTIWVGSFTRREEPVDAMIRVNAGELGQLLPPPPAAPMD